MMYNREEEFIALIRGKLKPQRFEHSLNVAKAAAALAERYGVDEEKAYICGILHDVMKNAEKQEQLNTILNSGLSVTALERANPKLWHAMAAAVFVRDSLGITDEDMINAIRYHTTARAHMSMLEKIVYIADYISQDRYYDGVDLMRQKAFDNINEAILEGTRFSIVELAREEKEIHTDTLCAYNEMCRLIHIEPAPNQ